MVKHSVDHRAFKYPPRADSFTRGKTRIERKDIAHCVHLRGQVSIIEGKGMVIVIDPSLAINTDNIPDYTFVELDRKGEVKEITENEYLTIKSNVTKDAQIQQFNNSTELDQN